MQVWASDAVTLIAEQSDDEEGILVAEALELTFSRNCRSGWMW